MANEIKLSIKTLVANGNYKNRWDIGQLSLTQNAQGAQSGIINVGTGAENIPVGDVSTPGILIMQNLDDTNFVEIGKDVSASFEATGQMKPGDPHITRVGDGVTLQLKADTAACKVQYLLLED